MRDCNVLLTMLAAAALVLTAAACKNSDQRAQGAGTPGAEEVPGDLEITFGQTGGFAGRMTGYTMLADGSLTEWEGKFPGENKRRTAPADSERAASLWRLATEAAILETSEQATGNMTWFVTVSAGGESRQVSWAGWPADGEAQTPAQRYYETCLEVAKAALDK